MRIFNLMKAKATNLLPAKNDPPLVLKAPKPSFAYAGHRSAFGFQAAVIPEVDHSQDNEHQDRNMAVDMDEGAVKMADPADSDDSMYTDGAVNKTEEGAMNEDVGGRDPGMVHPLSFNTLTFFART